MLRTVEKRQQQEAWHINLDPFLFLARMHYIIYWGFHSGQTQLEYNIF